MLPTHLVQKLSKIQIQRSQKENDGFSTLTVILLVNFVILIWSSLILKFTELRSNNNVHLGKIVSEYFTLL